MKLKTKIQAQVQAQSARYQTEDGAIGYIVLWTMGVPASLLFIVFLLRGCH